MRAAHPPDRLGTDPHSSWRPEALGLRITRKHSIRRECLDHIVVFGERHLRHLLRTYANYYNRTRTHLSLNKDSPVSRAIEPFSRILPVPILGGLHHQYVRI